MLQSVRHECSLSYILSYNLTVRMVQKISDRPSSSSCFLFVFLCVYLLALLSSFLSVRLAVSFSVSLFIYLSIALLLWTVCPCFSFFLSLSSLSHEWNRRMWICEISEVVFLSIPLSTSLSLFTSLPFFQIWIRCVCDTSEIVGKILQIGQSNANVRDFFFSFFINTFDHMDYIFTYYKKYD